MARIKIDKFNEYYNVELIDVFPDEVSILGGGYTEEEAIADMKANAETWLGYVIDEAKVEKYRNGELVEVQDGWKYEIIGKEYGSPCEDIHIFTNNLIAAVKAYRKAKKMFYSAFIVRNDKYIKEKGE